MKETHPNFISTYPLTAGKVNAGGLALPPVSVGDAQLPGYDVDVVKAKLGAARFNALLAAIAGKPYSGTLFSCGHRKDVNNVEVHCIYASDLELFLKNGG